MKASQVANLRQEVSAILAMEHKPDQVVIKLTSSGGLVHTYGLASSQLSRLREAQIPVSACVDTVAASGGYMMAVCAERIIAAPFAVLGSIGVVAQIPNIHRFLKNRDVDVELHTAGANKRTLTMLGENTPEGRRKFRKIWIKRISFLRHGSRNGDRISILMRWLTARFFMGQMHSPKVYATRSRLLMMFYWG